MRKLLVGFAGLVIVACFPIDAIAGVWTKPDPDGPKDKFPSKGVHSFLLNDGTDRTVRISARGPTTVNRDRTGPNEPPPGNLPHEDSMTDLDTINTEIVSLNLVGSTDLGGFYAEIIAGQGNGFDGFDPISEPTRGQIRDQDGTSDGIINFPADSFFDVFFDIFVDFNRNGIAELKEVFSNDINAAQNDPPRQFALRMGQSDLTQVPPEDMTVYDGGGMVWKFDPYIGTDWADKIEPAMVPLYAIDFDRTALDPNPVGYSKGDLFHTVTPEPSSMAIWAVLGVSALRRRRRTE